MTKRTMLFVGAEVFSGVSFLLTFTRSIVTSIAAFVVAAVCFLALAVGCGQVSSTQHDAGVPPDNLTDAGDASNEHIGGPCATTQIDDCQILICLDEHGHEQTVTKTALDDAGVGCVGVEP